MTQEQKAEAYDKAVREASIAYKDEDRHLKATLERIFPELKESESENIRKLCEVLVITCFMNELCTKEENDKCLSWLKKQREQEEPQVYETKNGEVITYSESKGYEVVKPKFKVGDWITNGHATYQITFIDSRYWYSETCVLGNVTDIDKTFHLWTIKDAKDGDVLVTTFEEDNMIVMYHSMCTIDTINVHCCLDNKFTRANLGVFDVEDVKPATREQRELLFQNMKDAGYKWDFDKKELKPLM